jgi:hypothetical protein
MTVGEFKKTSCLVVEPVQAKASTAILKGQLVGNDGAGFVAATVAISATSQIYAALDSVTAVNVNRTVRVVVRGRVVVNKAVASVAMQKGRKLIVGATAGTCALATAATDVIIAEVAEDSPAGVAEVEIWI